MAMPVTTQLACFQCCQSPGIQGNRGWYALHLNQVSQTSTLGNQELGNCREPHLRGLALLEATDFITVQARPAGRLNERHAAAQLARVEQQPDTLNVRHDGRELL